MMDKYQAQKEKYDELEKVNEAQADLLREERNKLEAIKKIAFNKTWAQWRRIEKIKKILEGDG